MSSPVPHAAASEGGPGAGAVLITGASGFIGGRLAARLSGEGRSVRCLVRAGSDTGALRELPVELAVGALGDPASLRRASAGCSALVHCAALVSDWATVAEIEATNVTGTASLLQAAAQAGVRRVVHISTTDVYGHPGSALLAEDAPPAGFANWYAQSKLQAEREVLRATRGSALEATILRPATVYGPGSNELVGEIARAIGARHMVLIDRGRAEAGLCYVENLIDAVLLALAVPQARGETFNVSDGLAVTWARFTGDLAAGLGAQPVRLSLPYPLAHAIAVSLEHGYRLLRARTGLQLAPLLSRQAVQVLGRDQSFSTAKARGLLGWEPRIDYLEGLRATLDWLGAREPAGGRTRAPRALGLDATGTAL